jgi:hypothetical protein
MSLIHDPSEKTLHYMETDSQEGLAVLEFCMERDHGCTSETSVHLNETTRLYIPESCPL